MSKVLLRYIHQGRATVSLRSAVITGSQGDNGVDLAVRPHARVRGPHYYFDCKNGTRNYGRAALRSLCSGMRYLHSTNTNCAVGILLVTSDFTARAREFVKGFNLRNEHQGLQLKLWKWEREFRANLQIFFNEDEPECGSVLRDSILRELRSEGLIILR